MLLEALWISLSTQSAKYNLGKYFLNNQNWRWENHWEPCEVSVMECGTWHWYQLCPGTPSCLAAGGEANLHVRCHTHTHMHIKMDAHTVKLQSACSSPVQTITVHTHTHTHTHTHRYTHCKALMQNTRACKDTLKHWNNIKMCVSEQIQMGLIPCVCSVRPCTVHAMCTLINMHEHRYQHTQFTVYSVLNKTCRAMTNSAPPLPSTCTLTHKYVGKLYVCFRWEQQLDAFHIFL